MQYRILAHITGYNDSNSLNKCIDSLLKQTYQISELLIIDNSSTALAISVPLGKISLNVHHHPENIGMAGSLCQGIQYAVNHGFDFIWTFDQDSCPTDDTLEKLITFYTNFSKKDQIGILGCVAVDDSTGQKDGGFLYKNYRFQKISCDLLNTYYECDAVITSGSLINCQIAPNVPLPNTLLFIDAVDFDYCMKIRQHNYKIFILNEAVLRHRFGNSRTVYLPCRSHATYLYTYSTLRYFYVHRNHTYLETRLARNLFFQVLSVAYRVLKAIRKVGVILIFEESDKLLKTYACLRGTVDGLLGRLGKTWH
ncbi:glycosyltransferase family 2 protein [Synechococcus sp. PCC 6716]|nr:glycosyltransferase family 2 protein [Synechococcus sp. PCC 6716]